jgi:hypothetical protein
VDEVRHSVLAFDRPGSLLLTITSTLLSLGPVCLLKLFPDERGLLTQITKTQDTTHNNSTVNKQNKTKKTKKKKKKKKKCDTSAEVVLEAALRMVGNRTLQSPLGTIDFPSVTTTSATALLTIGLHYLLIKTAIQQVIENSLLALNLCM